MARQRAQRQITQVIPDLSKAIDLSSIASITEKAGGALRAMQEKKDMARMNDFLADSQLQMIETTNKWRIDNEANPTDSKSIQKLDKEYDKILGQFNSQISGLSRDKWFEASSRLKNQSKLDNIKWGLNQEVKNAENNVNNSIEKNLEIARNMGLGGNVDNALNTFDNSRQAIKNFSDGVFSKQRTNEILEDYRSDYMEAFVGGMLEVDPQGALDLLKREDVKKSLNSKEREGALKDLSEKQIEEIDKQIEVNQIASELEATGFISQPDVGLSEKLARISKDENDEAISKEYADLARIFIKSKKAVEPKINTLEEAELIRLASDIKAQLGRKPNLTTSRAFLIRHRELNKLAMKYMDDKVATKDVNRILNSLNTSVANATAGIAGQGKPFIWDEANADKFFKKNLKNQLFRNQALREFFYETDGKDLSNQDRQGIAQQITKRFEDDLLGDSFDAEGSGYDYESAEKYGLTSDKTGHYPSRVPQTGLLLKGKTHKTFPLTEKAEKEAGFKIIKSGNRYFSLKTFKSIQAADKSGLPKGTVVLVGDRRYEI